MHNKEGAICPICGSRKVDKKTIKQVFEYNGSQCTMDNYIVFKCHNCKEEIVSRESLKRAQKLIVDFHRKVDGLLTSSEIKQIRLGLGYTQKEMGTLFGGGEKSFARYENATLRQSKAMDTVLRFLMKYPLLAMNVSADNQNRTPSIVIEEQVSYNPSPKEEYNIGEFKKASGF